MNTRQQSVQWLDVYRPFCEPGVATAAWTENLYVNPWCSVDIPAGSPNNPINFCTVARRACDDLLNANCVERFQTLHQETVAGYL